MTRTFTSATDESVIEMIRSASRRLAVIAPGVTTPVAKALAERIDLPPRNWAIHSEGLFS
jgi:hypothetical protein